MREGDPPGPMYVVEQGRVRVYKNEDGAESHLAFLRTGDFFGELSLFRDEPRAASARPSRTARCCASRPASSAACSTSIPTSGCGSSSASSSTTTAASRNVPLDFAEEILPAEASLQHVSPEQVELEPELEAEALADDGRGRRSSARSAGSRTSTSSTRWTAAPPAWRWSAATSAAPVGISHIRQAVHTSTDGTSLAGITRGAEELGLAARSVRASKSRLDELPLPAVVHWEGNHWVVVYASTTSTCASPTRRRGLRKIPREEFLERWSGYTAVVGYTERLAEAPEARTSLAWLRPFLRPHLRLVLFAVGLALVAAALADGAADLHPGRRRPRPRRAATSGCSGS